ncbi:MAG: replication protein RepA [Elusimicrobiota bacterium]|nr:replication protein RepA [Elusimicrobiota bacterium]
MTMTNRSSLLKLTDLVTQKHFEQIPEDIAFCSNIFMMFGLPSHRLKGNPAFWIKKSGSYNLVINRNVNYAIPSGCYARMNQIFIDTEVRTKNTNVIDVGQSFREYANKLGYKDGGADKELVKQLVNYVTSSISLNITDHNPNHIAGVQTMVAEAWDFFFDVPNPDQLTMAKGKIILSEKYAKYIHNHSVPLDMNVVRCFKRNPLALDFYRFLAYRSNELKKPISFPDHFLFEQIGVGHNQSKVTRHQLKIILRFIQGYWPVQAKFEDGYFELSPSAPAVQARIPSKSPLVINNICG